MYINQQCATLPPAVRHRYDKHKLFLMYFPISDHPDEFYYEICEKEILPKRWLYHCRECGYSFHPHCRPRIGKDRYVKFGHTIRVEDYQHLLTIVRESRYESSCNSCGKFFNREKAFECGICNFSLCFECACSMKITCYEENVCEDDDD